MLFLARVLHMPDGVLLRNMVLGVVDGAVNEFYCFSGERQSMVLVDDVFLSCLKSLKSIDDIKEIFHLREDERLYAYVPCGVNGLVLLG